MKIKGAYTQSKNIKRISTLSGSSDLCAAPEPRITHWYPSITETIPPVYPGLRYEFGKLENLMWRQRRGTTPPTPVLPDANDRWVKWTEKDEIFTIHYFRIHTIGYSYCPLHTEIYGSYRNQVARRGYWQHWEWCSNDLRTALI